MAFWRRSARYELPEDWEDQVARRAPTWWDVPLPQRTRVRDLMIPLLATKRWEAARGFEVTEEMRLVIASQAALAISGLDVDGYPNVGSIIVHPSTLVSSEERQGPVSGVMTDATVELAGEAGHGRGPIVLAWDEIVWDLRHPRRRRNVVIHEFAHKLDMLDDVVDGTPPLGDDDLRDRWIEVCTVLLEVLRHGEGSAVLDDYAAQDPGEFFAVSSEVFFTDPTGLRRHHPELYEVLAGFYRLDPAAQP